VAQLFSLGDFRFMKTYRILGIIWFGLFSYGGLQLLWLLMDTFFAPNSKAPLVANLLPICLCLGMLAGAVASIFLFLRGAWWARIYTGLFLCLRLVHGIVQYFQGFRPSVMGYIVDVIALVSVVLLFWPRHEPVA